MNEILEKIGKIGLVPVIKLTTPEQAVPLGKALMAGRIPVAEITFRSDAAEEGIALLAKELPELITGAGTVLTTEQADRAMAAGAKFIVTPGFNPKVVKHCLEKNIPITPGVNNPAHIEQAIELGLSVVKFFPAEASGGTAMLKALAGPYGSRVSFIPTGGVGIKNVKDYLALKNVFAVGGSWMVPTELLDAGEYDKIAALCNEARLLSLGFSLLHLGINPDGKSQEEMMASGRLLSTMLGLPFKEGTSSAFAGSSFEIMKQQGRGEKGHIAIETLSVERALEWFEGFGIRPVEESIKLAGDKIKLAYLDKELMGFAVHLNRK